MVEQQKDSTTVGAEREPPRLRAIPRLHDVAGVRRLMARVVREMYQEARDSLEGYRLVQALHLLSRVIEGAELEERVEEIEQLLVRRAA